MLNLVSSDGQTFSVDKQAIFQSMIIKNMIEDLGESSDPIPLPNVSGAILEKVIEFCVQHREEELPIAEEDDTRRRSIEMSDWDRQFINVDKFILFDIILAANYLDIKSLLDLGCKKVALMIQGKKTEEIRAMFQIENDFTPEEEEKIRKQNQWAESG
ncbi:hypothetical protein GYMLUDRAFT_71810 [Collybiopsis luxurians FD-317 M1]|uniref:E3 ubiquitin ligase complex SCF subunit n=1 Tax=Collybiopsis luxurians FD-317 M1 TaxID=944289 RepID=A0A0D0CVG5_9AGAR|nr:hypothetical protein GYMLUDRAFT_71810 [Collybiopsis luxurians FD-317 M1]